MKKIIFLLLGITMVSCTQIQTQIQNTNGKVCYQNFEKKNTQPNFKISTPLKEKNYEYEIIEQKIKTYIVLQ